MMYLCNKEWGESINLWLKKSENNFLYINFQLPVLQLRMFNLCENEIKSDSTHIHIEIINPTATPTCFLNGKTHNQRVHKLCVGDYYDACIHRYAREENNFFVFIAISTHTEKVLNF